MKSILLFYRIRRSKQTRFFILLLFCSVVGNIMFYYLSDIYSRDIQTRFTSTLTRIYNDIERKGERFVCEKDSIIERTDNTISFDGYNLCDIGGDKIVTELRNGFFVHKSTALGKGKTVHYLYLIKHNYEIENDYLQNTFSEAFSLDKNIEIVDYRTDYPIIWNGKTVCYLDASPECFEKSEKSSFIFHAWLIVNIFFIILLIINVIFAGSDIKEKSSTICKVLLCLLLCIVYLVICVLLVRNNTERILSFCISSVNYESILDLLTITLFGYLVFICACKILPLDNNRDKSKTGYILVRKFAILMIIAVLTGIVMRVFSGTDRLPVIEEESVTVNKPSDSRNFYLLMDAVAKDSVICNYIVNNDYVKAENYIEKYYLSLIKQTNHTSVLVFDEKDSVILQPDKRSVKTLHYIKNRINNSEQSDSMSYAFTEFSEQDIPTYLYFFKIKDAYVFAECLHKHNNENMNYSLFLESSPVTESRELHSESRTLYSSLSGVSLIFFLLCLLFGIQRFVASLSDYRKRTLSIKSKILASLLGSFVVSVVVLGIFGIRSTMNLNKRYNENILKEKTQSIALETGKILNISDTITNLDLIEISNTFLSDVNIFDEEGKLVVCSQEDIFNRGIISDRINPHALEIINENPDTLFWQEESICNGRFLASYIKVFDMNHSTAYIVNLPFINQQKIMNDNIDELISNFANMFLFWVNVAVLIFVFLSNIITKPLELVKDRMSRINLNVRNDKIVWQKNDEMGQLIKSYNSMLDKIEESAVLLQQQERQSSWRELAKQVAHDIKNPLTPMKLSIQYLQRLFDAKKQGNEKAAALFENKWQDITSSLISQIETLSTITQELNSYSKPVAKKEKVNLDSCILSAINLFNNVNDVRIVYSSKENCFVSGDEKLFIRIFNNLIKNSMQALYNKSNGQINIAIKENENRYIVSVEDNGCGIKDNDKDKIFNTQFTTKTNGNGIGLTIVKTILENYNAQISFRSKENVGTVFFIDFEKL